MSAIAAYIAATDATIAGLEARITALQEANAAWRDAVRELKVVIREHEREARARQLPETHGQRLERLAQEVLVRR